MRSTGIADSQTRERGTVALSSECDCAKSGSS
jgi:hypothetical protein